mmetsp:Transcript_4239/g.9930  ORF Transcript_4239/g.9930 Transcript_4239/m.9930 type:complete len:93 (+) Transcript_4239:836-1114(+)
MVGIFEAFPAHRACKWPETRVKVHLVILKALTVHEVFTADIASDGLYFGLMDLDNMESKASHRIKGGETMVAFDRGHVLSLGGFVITHMSFE